MASYVDRSIRMSNKQSPLPFTTDYLDRGVYVLRGTRRIFIGTCNPSELSDVLREKFRNDGMEPRDYFLSRPVLHSASVMDALEDYCRQIGREIRPGLFEADYESVCRRLKELTRDCLYEEVLAEIQQDRLLF